MIHPVSLDAYDAARTRVGLIDREALRIVVSGEERRSYLHGLLTNDIASLGAGQGVYAAYLTPQGRMITDMWVHELGDVILLTLPRDVKDAVLARLDQLVFTEDVQLGDITESFGALAVVGPQSSHVISQAIGADVGVLDSLPEQGNGRLPFQRGSVIALRLSDAGASGYDLLVERAQLGELRSALRRLGAIEIDEGTAEALRIEAGVPRFHRDMAEDTIPLEAGIENRAISFTKGCYVGQEVIVRVLHRGHGRVARRLVGLLIDGGEVPAVGATVRSETESVGRVTSSCWSPGLERPVALAYVQRESAAAGTRLTVDASTATVSGLPFVPHQ